MLGENHVCPYHSKVEEAQKLAAEERTRIWQHTGTKLSFKVFSIILSALIVLVGWVINAQFQLVREVRMDVGLIKQSQYELKEYVEKQVMEIKYEVRSVTEKQKTDEQRSQLERSLINKNIENLKDKYKDKSGG